VAIRPVTRIHCIPNHLKVSLMSRSESKTMKLIARAGVGVAILLGAVSAVVAQPASGGMQGGPGMMQHGGPGMPGGMKGQHEGMAGGMRGGMGDRGGMMGMHGGGGHRMERMLHAAGATPEQRAKVHQIMKAAHEDMQKQHEAGRALHQQMAQLLSAPKLDAAAVEAQRQKLSAQHDAASKRMTQAMLDASAVLTPEQREKMVSTMKARKDMMERHRREREAIDPARRS
jgi:Spy/CpxP family protein refolding chaperone